MRRVTWEVAFEGGWSLGRARKVADLFDSMAAEWDEPRSGLVRTAPIRDALARGSMRLGGRWLELGAGTGVGTRIMGPALAAAGGRLVAADLARQMLLNSPQRVAPLVQGDASVLPFGDACFDGVALVNMLLFPDEVDRLVGDGGQVLWINTSGDRTPIHLSPADFLAALPGQWSACWAGSGTGFWVVADRAEMA
jgi:ubiquinone/menaquinone biosynthesis C-methylase UbiE